MTQTTSISFFRFARVRDRVWAFAQMGAARFALPRVVDIGFWKLCGSGTGEGFTPLPNTAVWAIIATWPSPEIARDRVATARTFRNFRARSEENWTVFLAPTSARGKWSGESPFAVQTEPVSGPVAALTRATIRLGILTKFWRRVPDISAVIGKDPNVVFKIGIGEVPWLHQVTFSIWPDEMAMANFAREDGPHAEAIRAVRDGQWFREELYARFAIVGESGSWGGASPIAGLRCAP